MSGESLFSRPLKKYRREEFRARKLRKYAFRILEQTPHFQLNGQIREGDLHLAFDADRRAACRLPMELPLRLKIRPSGEAVNATTLDVHPSGLQVETRTPLREHMAVELWPAGNDHDLSTEAARGEIRWARSTGRRCFRAGVALRQPARWSVKLSILEKALSCDVLTGARFLGRLLSSTDDGLLLLDEKLRILAANSGQPFCLPNDPERLRGKSLRETSHLLALRAGDETFHDLFQRVLQSGQEMCLCAYRYSPPASASDMVPQYFHIWISPMEGPDGVHGIVVRTRDVTALQRLCDYERKKGEGLWHLYRYQLLGQLAENLLEEIINPLSAAVGRLDLLALKIGAIEQRLRGPKLGPWREDLDAIHTIMNRLTDMCRATTRQRDREAHAATEAFSLNDLVQEELHALDLRSSSRMVMTRVSLAPTLPLTRGSYSHWATTFTSLCHAMIRNMAISDPRVLTVQTAVENTHVVLCLGHTGQALATPLEKEPTLNMLCLMRKTYGVIVSVAGESGLQTITLKVEAYLPEALDVS